MPSNWFAKTFTDAAWPNATTFTEAQVGVNGKPAYTNFPGQFANTGGSFIWSSNLVLDNEVIVRYTGPASTQQIAVEQPSDTPGGEWPAGAPTSLQQGSGRGDRIRTCDLLVPNQALYQAKLHPDIEAGLCGHLRCRQAWKKRKRLATTIQEAGGRWRRRKCFSRLITGSTMSAARRAFNQAAAGSGAELKRA